jgi:hypothetical protein
MLYGHHAFREFREAHENPKLLPRLAYLKIRFVSRPLLTTIEIAVALGALAYILPEIIAGALLANAAAETTVIGSFPQYLELAEILDANRFSIPADIWETMTEAEQWAANKAFLDEVIASGRNFVLSTPIDLAGPGSYFEQELEYLYANGYRVVSEGTKMIRIF